MKCYGSNAAIGLLMVGIALWGLPSLAAGKIPPMVIVAPDGDDNWYVDDPDPEL